MHPVMKKYIIRVIKYFIYVCVLMSVILIALMALKIVDTDINALFRNGYDSLWQIALMFLAVAAIYPRFGFRNMGTTIPGSFAEIRGGIVEYMENRGYKLEYEEGENMTFRLRSPIMRLFRMCEDRITMTRELPGYRIEGLGKDVIRISTGLENKFREQ